MSCINFRNKVREYIDGELHNDLKEFMDKHLEKCEECRNFYIEEKQLDDLFEIALIHPEIEFKSCKDNVMKKIDKNKYVNKARIYKSLVMAASILILIVIGIDINRSNGVMIDKPVLENRENGFLLIEASTSKNIEYHVEVFKYNVHMKGINSLDNRYVANVYENDIYVQTNNDLTTKKYVLEIKEEVGYIKWKTENIVEINIPKVGIYEIHVDQDHISTVNID